MLSWILPTLCATLLTLQSQGAQPPPTRPATTQPSTQPADTSSTLRKPAQANILKGLLRDGQRPEPIRPVESAAPKKGAAAEGADGLPLLLEGTMLVERPGRLIHEEGRAKLVLLADTGSQSPRTIEIVPSQLLEAMEREAQAGFNEFVVSAEVTRYKDRNYLMLRKILRRVGNRNVGP
jgi:hypothetical protein